MLFTVNNKIYSEYWGKIPGIFKLFHRYSKMENDQNIYKLFPAYSVPEK